MSPPAGAATRAELQLVLAKIETVGAEVAQNRASTAADIASLKTGQEHDRANATEKHTQNRNDIHNLRGDVQGLGDRFYSVKEELKDEINKKFDELGAKITAQVVKNAKNEKVIKWGETAILAIVMAVVSAVISHFVKP